MASADWRRAYSRFLSVVGETPRPFLKLPNGRRFKRPKELMPINDILFVTYNKEIATIYALKGDALNTFGSFIHLTEVYNFDYSMELDTPDSDFKKVLGDAQGIMFLDIVQTCLDLGLDADWLRGNSKKCYDLLANPCFLALCEQSPECKATEVLKLYYKDRLSINPDAGVLAMRKLFLLSQDIWAEDIKSGMAFANYLHQEATDGSLRLMDLKPLGSLYVAKRLAPQTSGGLSHFCQGRLAQACENLRSVFSRRNGIYSGAYIAGMFADVLERVFLQLSWLEQDLFSSIIEEQDDTTILQHLASEIEKYMNAPLGNTEDVKTVWQNFDKLFVIDEIQTKAWSATNLNIEDYVGEIDPNKTGTLYPARVNKALYTRDLPNGDFQVAITRPQYIFSLAKMYTFCAVLERVGLLDLLWMGGMKIYWDTMSIGNAEALVEPLNLASIMEEMLASPLDYYGATYSNQDWAVFEAENSWQDLPRMIEVDAESVMDGLRTLQKTYRCVLIRQGQPACDPDLDVLETLHFGVFLSAPGNKELIDFLSEKKLVTPVPEVDLSP